MTDRGIECTVVAAYLPERPRMTPSSAGQTRSRTTARVRAHSMLASAVRSGIAARSTPAVITGQGYADERPGPPP